MCLCFVDCVVDCLMESGGGVLRMESGRRVVGGKGEN